MPKPRLLSLTLLLALLALSLAGCKWPFAAHEHAGPKYHCPMHPTVVADKPGPCPICGMDLVPITEGSTPTAENLPKTGVPGLEVVGISAQSRQKMGMKLEPIEKSRLAREVRTSARIVANEGRLWRVNTKIEGWVEELFVTYTGQEVKKGDPLLSIYSPELVSAQAEYLAALRAQGATKDNANSLVASARRRLELWDITDEQVERLARTGKVEKSLTLYAPASGVVIERNILAGQKIVLGNSLMTIADLSVVWGDADIYQSDLPYVKVGMPLEMSLPYWPGKVFTGKVIFVSPTLDGESRTLRARLELPNEEALLKPGMFGDARLYYELGEKLSIPATAVMWGGQRTYAFLDGPEGHLIPTEVKLGARSGDRYELLGGLKAGDKVVTSANFLVDSESNLKAALVSLSPDNTAGAETQLAAIPANQFGKVIDAYLRVQNALATDDLVKAKAAAEEISTVGIEPAERIAKAESIDVARQHFKALSDSVIAAARTLGAPANHPLFQFECAMANGNTGALWLQSSKEAQNPYFGSVMLRCGESKGEIAIATAPRE